MLKLIIYDESLACLLYHYRLQIIITGSNAGKRVKKGLKRLRADLDEKLVGFRLMNETFTMADLQKLYEAVFDKKLVRTNFQRKMLSLNVLERLEKHYTGKAHKAPYLYKFIKNEH